MANQTRCWRVGRSVRIKQHCEARSPVSPAAPCLVPSMLFSRAIRSRRQCRRIEAPLLPRLNLALFPALLVPVPSARLHLTSPHLIIHQIPAPRPTSAPPSRASPYHVEYSP